MPVLVGADNNSCLANTRTTVSCCRLALVSRHSCTNDWTSAGGGAGDGRSLCVHPIDWIVSVGFVVGGGSSSSCTNPVQMAGHRCATDSTSVRDSYLPSGRLLARYRVVLAAHTGS